MTRLSYGVALLKIKRYQDARVQFEKARSIDPNYAPAYYNLATYYSLIGDAAQAVQHLSRAISLFPECRKWAERDSDFDSIKDNAAFKALFEQR